MRGSHRGKPSVLELYRGELDVPIDKVVPRSGSCSTKYVRRVSGDELYTFIVQQSCELHDFLYSAGVSNGEEIT